MGHSNDVLLKEVTEFWRCRSIEVRCIKDIMFSILYTVKPILKDTSKMQKPP